MGEGRVVLEIKSHNHRFLEVRARAPRELLAGEVLVERLLQDRLSRGYCTVNLWYEGRLGGSTAIDKGALKSHLDSLIEVGNERELCLADLIGVLAGAPDLFVTPRVEDEDELATAITDAFEQAIESLSGMREAEGRIMAEDFAARIESLRKGVAELERLAETWPKIALERLKKRLKMLVEDKDTGLDPARLATEAAILADRSDISEELTRLASHLEQMETLADSNVPVGRKAEFLIQEMSREANTIGSKTAQPEINSIVIEIKSDLEKMRELAQNIE